MLTVDNKTERRLKMMSMRMVMMGERGPTALAPDAQHLHEPKKVTTVGTCICCCFPSSAGDPSDDDPAFPATSGLLLMLDGSR